MTPTRRLGTARKPGWDIKVGDILIPFGVPHLIHTLDVYDGPLLDVLGAGTRIARAAGGWSMVIDPDTGYTVAAV